jgi:hypothetical protein
LRRFSRFWITATLLSSALAGSAYAEEKASSTESHPEHEHTHADDGHDHAAHAPSAKALKEQAIAMAVKADDMETARLRLHEWLRLGGEPDTMVFMGLVLRHPAFTRLLIAEGASPNATAQGMYKGVPALQVSLLEGEPMLAMALIQAGANVHQRDPKGHTALMVAAISGQHDVVKALLEHKAKVRATNTEGFTALQLMMKNMERARLSAQMYTQYQRIISLLDEAELHSPERTSP